MNMTGPYAGGAASTARKAYDQKDGRNAAVSLLSLIEDFADSRMVYDYITSEPLPPNLRLKAPTSTGAGANAEQYRIDLKKYEDQTKALGDVKVFVKTNVTDSAWRLMQIYSSHALNGVMDAREVYSAFKTAFCTLTDVEKLKSIGQVRTEWQVNTPVDDHIVAHAIARHELNVGSDPISQGEQVQELEYSLRNLFAAGVHFASKESIAVEFNPSRGKVNAFNIYVQVIMQRVKRGEFADVSTPLPAARVHAVKEGGAGGEKPRRPFQVLSSEAKLRNASCSLDSNCPEHTHRNKSGNFHKWRDCSYYTGVKYVPGLPNGK